MAHNPEMTFLMQAHATALLALTGRCRQADQLKLVRLLLRLSPVPPAHADAVARFLDAVRADAAGAGEALRAFILDTTPIGDSARSARAAAPRYDWQNRKDLQ